MAEYQGQATRQVQRLVKPSAFNKGELDLRQTFEERKFQQNYEGPYVIAGDGIKGAYRIQSLGGGMEPRPWNSLYLRKYFQ